MLSQRGAMATRAFMRASGKQSQNLLARNMGAKRIITTESITSSSAADILAAQRLKRPISPHIAIYQPQLTWYMSSFHRITGVILSGPLYLFMMAYLISPYVGWHLESASVAAWFAGLPFAVKAGIKGTMALPFAFHSWNGCRHLLWDTARELTVRGVYRTGYVVLGLTAVSTVYLAVM